MRLRVLAIGSLAVLVGCGGASFQQAKLAATKTAAVIGFSGEVNLADPNQQGGISGMASAFQGMKDVSSADTEARRREQAEKTYDLLAEKIGTGLGWTIAKRELVANNPEMAALYKEKMGERRPNAGIRYGIPNVPWSEMVGGLSAEEQQRLRKALGVDALIIAKMTFMAGRTYGATVGGVGKNDLWPKAVLSFTVVDGGPEGPLWNERWVEGVPSQQNHVTVSVGVVDTTNETSSLLEAASLGVDALLQKYQQNQQAVAAAR